MTWTEPLIQNLLYRYYERRRHKWIVPSSCLFGWESDLLTVTKAGLIYECEIKVTKADFRVDCRKEKFDCLMTGLKKSRYDGQDYAVQRPNFFSYAVPYGLIDIADVPEYAGVLYVSNNEVEIAKPPTKIHDERITEKQLRQLSRSLMYRYWRLRTRAV